MNRSFLWGAVVAAAAIYGYHHFVKPLPGPKGM